MNKEKKLKIQLMVSLLTAIILVGTATGLALYYIFPEYWFRWYPLIPSYFVLLGLIISIGMNYCIKREPRKIISAFIMMRGIKIALTLVGFLLYYCLVNENTTEAALLTCGFYFLYLFVETYLLYRFEKANKQTHKRDV